MPPGAGKRYAVTSPPFSGPLRQRAPKNTYRGELVPTMVVPAPRSDCRCLTGAPLPLVRVVRHSGAVMEARATTAPTASLQVLLACGIAAPMLYALADRLAGMRWAGYSFRDQTISELGAIGAPPRALFSGLLFIVYVLMVAFGIGIWKAFRRNRRLRTVGGLIIGVGVLALTAGQLSAMEQRGTEQGLAGALHLAEGLAAMLLIFASMAIAATALGRRFGFYTVASLVVALGFGAWSAMEIPHVEQGVATPWLGVKERIFWYSYQSWYVVLALTLLHQARRSRHAR